MKFINVVESFTAERPSYNRFAKLQNEIINSDDADITINIKIQNRLGYTFLFLISTLPYLAERYGKNLHIYFNEKSLKLMQKLGLLKKKKSICITTDYSEELKECSRRITEDNHIFNLVREITNEAPVEMNDKLAALFISKAGEMYNNAREHSEGTVIGAKYYRNQKNIYCFSCYDTGIGIPNKVLSTRKDITTPLDAFKWAMVSGNSTVMGDVPRGLGMTLLQSFAKANEGTIRICSGNVLYIYSPKSNEKYYVLDHPFCGTLFEMDIIADNNMRYIIR